MDFFKAELSMILTLKYTNIIHFLETFRELADGPQKQ